MPDYNPAIAAGIQPPQSNLLPTLEGIAQLQIGQAHAGLYSLQALQQQNDYNALGAVSQQMQADRAAGRPFNPSGLYQTFIANKGDPNKADMVLKSAGQANALSAAGGMEPSAANTLAEIPGTRAKSASALEEYYTNVRGGAAAVANGYLANPGPASKRAMVEYTRQHQGDDAADQVANLSDDELMGRAREFVGRGLTAEQGAKMVQTENQEGAPVYQTQAQFLAGPQTGGVVGANPQQKEQQKYYADLYKGISAQGNTSAANLDDIHLAKAAINDPNFYSGQGQTYNLMAKKFAAMGLGDPAAALPQEVLSKVMAANILQQVNGMKAAAEGMGAGSSRLFASQIDLMEKAAQNPENTVAANRFLTEMAERAANKNIGLADKAAAYKNGKLDPQFETQFRKDASKPVFSNWELAHLDTIGAPMADRLAKIDPREIQHLKANPNTADRFDAFYGPGTARAAGAQ